MMHDLKRYRVTGVSKTAGADVQVEFDALNEANARVKAELRDIVVTSVEQVTLPASPSTKPPSPSPEPTKSVEPHVAQDNAAKAQAFKVTTLPPPSKAFSVKSSRRWGWTVPAVGWVILALALLAAIFNWVDPYHQRDPAIEAMVQSGDSYAIAEGVAFLLGNSTFGIVAAIIGLMVFFIGRHSGGKALVAVSLVTIVINVAGQCRPSSAILSGTGFTTTSQAKQAAKDMSRMFDRAIPPPGEAPFVLSDTIASLATHGELSHLVKVTEDLLAGMLADLNEYQTGTLALQLESVLLPTRLDSAAEINDSKAKLAAAQQLLDKYEAGVRARMKAARDDFATAPYAASLRERMMRNFDKGMATTMPHLERVLSYEEEMYSELTALLDFMLTQQGKFHQVGNQLKFDDEASAATYNASLTRYLAIAAKQTALRELMHEGAKANADRFRRSADTGVFDEAPMATPAGNERPVRVELSPDGPSINGHVIAFPLEVSEVIALLGPPSRTVAKANTIRVWDAAGVYTYSKPGSEEVDSIAIAINRQHEYDFSPKKLFSGAIFLASVEVRDIDTPRSLNRRLEGVAFKSFDQCGISWDIQFPTYSIGMSLDKGGLSDTIMIRIPKGKAAPSSP